MIYYGTETSNETPARTRDERLHRCYELAAAALIFGTVPRNTVLVHGSVHHVAAPHRIGHAWLEFEDDTVWEPIAADHWPNVAWNAFVRPLVEARYTLKEAQLQVITHKHYGPWHGIHADAVASHDDM